MSMFNRLLASVGIGNAKVDTLLEHSRYAPGGEVRGVVKMQGGQVSQKVDGIQLSLLTQYVRESNDNQRWETFELSHYRISDAFTLQPNESKEYPFTIQLPYATPLTIGQAPVWLKTTLDIASAVDPNDNDRLEIIPNVEQSIVIDALNRLGFRLRKADCEYAPRIGGHHPFVQEFEFVPTSYFRGDLDELEVIFIPIDGQLELLLQIDRRARGIGGWLTEAMDMDETFVRYRLPHDEWRRLGAEGVSAELAELIRRYI
ncbi:sporulation protein [Paenibacillus aquistagni]|uniref:Sporulation-control protein n=1 Tax=Paenibacillus aquistagni TaxID=1852522 RepID=A0A1X7LA48_9BACL|nr:sporulation protein [Paenibacillus aquistagni]SMG50580.1 sporulation-control protein [Paenibacillus aquistagni]